KLVGEDVRLDMEGRIGKMFGEESRILAGLQASLGNAARTNQIAVSLNNELHKQVSLSLQGTKAVIGNLSFDLTVDDLNTNEPVLGIGFRYTFR
ncbi:MAG: hypothetical protein ABIF01_03260, partial [Candidatus Micrarchaeota archaeon]